VFVLVCFLGVCLRTVWHQVADSPLLTVEVSPELVRFCLFSET
jgi:hypothetical protein